MAKGNNLENGKQRQSQCGDAESQEETREAGSPEVIELSEHRIRFDKEVKQRLQIPVVLLTVGTMKKMLLLTGTGSWRGGANLGQVDEVLCFRYDMAGYLVLDV